jgi:hypothetical protein
VDGEWPVERDVVFLIGAGLFVLVLAAVAALLTAT